MNPARGCPTTPLTYPASGVPPSHRGQIFQASLIKAEADLGLQCIHSPTKLSGPWPSRDSYSKYSRDRPLLIWQLETWKITAESWDVSLWLQAAKTQNEQDSEKGWGRFQWPGALSTEVQLCKGRRQARNNACEGFLLPANQKGKWWEKYWSTFFFYNEINKIYATLPPPLTLISWATDRVTLETSGKNRRQEFTKKKKKKERDLRDGKRATGLSPLLGNRTGIGKMNFLTFESPQLIKGRGIWGSCW